MGDGDWWIALAWIGGYFPGCGVGEGLGVGGPLWLQWGASSATLFGWSAAGRMQPATN